MKNVLMHCVLTLCPVAERYLGSRCSWTGVRTHAVTPVSENMVKNQMAGAEIGIASEEAFAMVKCSIAGSIQSA